jgi:hypothetical protein
MLLVRYALPAAIVLGGVLMWRTGGQAGTEGFLLSLGAAASVLLMNLLFRFGARGDDERLREAEAREYYARHGRWPDET